MKSVWMILVLVLIACPVMAGSNNSGALTTSTRVDSGVPDTSDVTSVKGVVTSVTCLPDGANACGCTVYDNTTNTGTQIKGAWAAALTVELKGWTASKDSAPVLRKGIYVVPSATSTCFVEWAR